MKSKSNELLSIQILSYGPDIDHLIVLTGIVFQMRVFEILLKSELLDKRELAENIRNIKYQLLKEAGRFARNDSD